MHSLRPEQVSISSRFSHVVLSYILATHVVTSCLLRAAKNDCRDIWKPDFSHPSQAVQGGKCQSCLMSWLSATLQDQSWWLNFQTVGSVCLCPIRDSSPGHSPTHSALFNRGPWWWQDTFTSCPWPLVANLAPPDCWVLTRLSTEGKDGAVSAISHFCFQKF